jgi:hypothetical protein
MPLLSDANRPFVDSLRAHFPEVAAEIDAMDTHGLLHMEVSAFEAVSVRAYDRGDLDAVRCYFAFADDALGTADEALTNALHVSYVEGFALGAAHDQTARSLMPPRLAAAFDAVQAHFGMAPGETA